MNRMDQFSFWQMHAISVRLSADLSSVTMSLLSVVTADILTVRLTFFRLLVMNPQLILSDFHKAVYPAMKNDIIIARTTKSSIISLELFFLFKRRNCECSQYDDIRTRILGLASFSSRDNPKSSAAKFLKSCQTIFSCFKYWYVLWFESVVSNTLWEMS